MDPSLNSRVLSARSMGRGHAASSSNGRRLKRRGQLGFYLVLSFLFLALETFAPSVTVKIRGYANDLVAPILSILAKPISATQSGLERIAGASDVYIDNQRLLDENDRMRQWQKAAQVLMGENERLKAMLKAPAREVPTAATGRVVGIGGGSFERSVIINVGSRDSVRRDYPVVDDSGLLGRVIHVGQISARTLLITDLNSRIPVRFERTGVLAIAEGQNDAYLRLAFLSKNDQITVGDRLLTSGHGAVYPPDIPVGRVVSISGDVVVMEPMALIDRLDFIKVLAYQPLIPENESQVLPQNVDPANDTGGRDD